MATCPWGSRRLLVQRTSSAGGYGCWNQRSHWFSRRRLSSGRLDLFVCIFNLFTSFFFFILFLLPFPPTAISGHERRKRAVASLYKDTKSPPPTILPPTFDLFKLSYKTAAVALSAPGRVPHFCPLTFGRQPIGVGSVKGGARLSPFLDLRTIKCLTSSSSNLHKLWKPQKTLMNYFSMHLPLSSSYLVFVNMIVVTDVIIILSLTPSLSCFLLSFLSLHDLWFMHQVI